MTRSTAPRVPVDPLHDQAEVREPNWLPIVIVVWVAVLLAYTANHLWPVMTAGVPPDGYWQRLGANLMIMVVPAALIPVLLFLFRRVRAAPRALPAIVSWYVLIGIGYWLAWALLTVALVDVGVVHLPPPRPGILQAVVFQAFSTVALYTILVMLFEVVHYFDESRRRSLETGRLQAEVTEAQAAVLSAQLNPRFVFQTFSAASEMMDHDVRAARRMLTDLSELLRVSLGGNGHQLIELRDEFQLLQRYLEIQQARLGVNLHFELNADPVTSAWRVPPLLLQPLVEAVLPSDEEADTARFSVRILARQAGRSLRILVSNDREDDRPIEGAVPGHRDGFDTTRERLELTYGGRASLDLLPTARGLEIGLTIPEVSSANPTMATENGGV